VGWHDQALLIPEGGRLIQTHEPYRKEYRKAVYIVRDPRDVVISEFAYQRALGWVGVDFDEFLNLFLLGKVNGYGSWCDHVRGWLEAAASKQADVLVIRFEEMRRNTASALAATMRFLGVTTSSEKLESAIRSNSIEGMRAKEDRSPQIGRSSSEEHRFVRRGSVGGWRGKLTPAQSELIGQYVDSTLRLLGYENETPASGLTHQGFDFAVKVSQP
jgi:hypothetical protein